MNYNIFLQNYYIVHIYFIFTKYWIKFTIFLWKTKFHKNHWNNYEISWHCLLIIINFNSIILVNRYIYLFLTYNRLWKSMNKEKNNNVIVWTYWRDWTALGTVRTMQAISEHWSYDELVNLCRFSCNIIVNAPKTQYFDFWIKRNFVKVFCMIFGILNNLI